MKVVKCKVVHSLTQSSWNLVGTELGGKHKIARFPYGISGDAFLDSESRKEAFEHATFASKCFSCADRLSDPNDHIVL